MNGELAIVMGLLVAAIAMFAYKKPRMDAVALIMLVALPLSGIITVPESLAGFADPNIVLIAALFVIGDGLVRTGVARWLGDWLTAKSGSSETRLIVMLMVSVCALGSFMSSTAVTAIFIPVVLRVAQSTGASPRRLLMPLSMAALISGMMTLVATTPNLIVSSELERSGFEGFNFFAFTPFGVPILGMGIVYVLFARRWLNGDVVDAAEKVKRPKLREWIEQYQLANREHRVAVNEGSPLCGCTLADLRIELTTGAKLLAIQRGRNLMQPHSSFEFAKGDILLVDYLANETEVDDLRSRYDLQPLSLTGGYFSDLSQEIGMAEVLLPPSSSLVGKTLAETHFYDEYGLRVIGMRHGRDPITDELEGQQLGTGDTLLVAGPWRAIRNLQSHSEDLVVFNTPAEMQEVLPVVGRGLHAFGCLVLVVVLMASGVIPNVLAALIGCLLMGAFGVTDLTSAYRSIDWKTIVLVVGMLPFSIALQRTGGVDMIAEAMIAVTYGTGPRVVLATIFGVTALLGMFISNTATAVLMAPIAVTIALDLDASPMPFAMTVALAASTAFMTPVSSPVNTLVVTPGNYTFADFLRVGVPFAILVMIFCVTMIPIVFPL
jgi:di/tricarboxylate transporter